MWGVKWSGTFQLTWNEVFCLPALPSPLDFAATLQKAQDSQYVFSWSGIIPWLKIWTSSEMDLTFSAVLNFCLDSAPAGQPTAGRRWHRWEVYEGLQLHPFSRLRWVRSRSLWVWLQGWTLQITSSFCVMVTPRNADHELGSFGGGYAVGMRLGIQGLRTPLGA